MLFLASQSPLLSSPAPLLRFSHSKQNQVGDVLPDSDYPWKCFVFKLAPIWPIDFFLDSDRLDRGWRLCWDGWRCSHLHPGMLTCYQSKKKERECFCYVSFESARRIDRRKPLAYRSHPVGWCHPLNECPICSIFSILIDIYVTIKWIKIGKKHSKMEENEEIDM